MNFAHVRALEILIQTDCRITGADYTDYGADYTDYGADYADYITSITRREILARPTTPSDLNNNNQYLFLLLSHLHIYDENILYSWYVKVET